jgi:hypothetical protein
MGSRRRRRIPPTQDSTYMIGRALGHDLKRSVDLRG